MISISDVVGKMVSSSPFLEDALMRGIVNYAALAREMRPEIKKTLIKDVELGAIVMALRRIRSELSTAHDVLPKKIITDITVRSKLRTYTYFNSPTIASRYAQLHTIINNNSFYNISQGIRETTIIVSEDVSSRLESLMREERFVNAMPRVSSITLCLTHEANRTSGAYYTLLKLLAWEGITILEVVSTHMELTLVFDEKDVDRAFSVLKKFMLQ